MRDKRNITCPICGEQSPINPLSPTLWEWECSRCGEDSYPFRTAEALLKAAAETDNWYYGHSTMTRDTQRSENANG